MLEKLHIPVAHGRLEALLAVPDGPPNAAAVVCHPHPLHGGTMHNNVAYRIARALFGRGLATLRFNFRGVGSSTGTHDHGVGEEQDVAAALDYLHDAFPGLPLWAAGFSFGARVGLRAGDGDARVEKLLGVGLVPRLFDFSFLQQSDKPKALIHGALDELADLASVRALFETFAPPRHFSVVADATHLFPGKLDQLDLALTDAIDFLIAAPGSGPAVKSPASG